MAPNSLNDRKNILTPLQIGNLPRRSNRFSRSYQSTLTLHFGLYPALRTLTSFISRSNQKGAPIDKQAAVTNQPSKSHTIRPNTSLVGPLISCSRNPLLQPSGRLTACSVLSTASSSSTGLRFTTGLESSAILSAAMIILVR